MAKQTTTATKNTENATDSAENAKDTGLQLSGNNLPASNEETEETPAEEVETEEVHALSLESEFAAKMMAMLDKVDDMRGYIPLNAEYFKDWVKGEEMKGMYCGVHLIPAKEGLADSGRVKDGMIETIRFLTKNKQTGERQMYLIGDIIAVSTLSQLPSGIPISITYIGDEKGKSNGKYKVLRINQIF